MNNKQHSLSVLLAALCALCMLFSIFPAAVFADGTEDDAAAAEESSADSGGQLVIGYVDGSAGKNEGKRLPGARNR